MVALRPILAEFLRVEREVICRPTHIRSVSSSGIQDKMYPSSLEENFRSSMESSVVVMVWVGGLGFCREALAK
jgi:hypothetical protein